MSIDLHVKCDHVIKRESVVVGKMEHERLLCRVFATAFDQLSLAQVPLQETVVDVELVHLDGGYYSVISATPVFGANPSKNISTGTELLAKLVKKVGEIYVTPGTKPLNFVMKMPVRFSDLGVALVESLGLKEV